MNFRTVVPAIIIMYGLIPLAFSGHDYLMGLMVSALTIAGIAVSWALLGNLGGMVSFGHAAFVGVGAYTSSILAMTYGFPIFISLIFGGVGAAISSIAAMPALRLRGPYFALAILAYAEIFRVLASEMSNITGGAGGLLSIPRLPEFMGIDFSGKVGGYFVILNIVTLCLITYHLIRRSTYGLALKAMHDSELATRIVGVPATYLKALMLLVAAFMAGCVGAFNAHFINFLDPDYAFSGEWTVIPMVAAIFGGYRTLTGPVIGALVIYLSDQLIFKNLLPQGHQLVLGALLGAMILFSPTGLLPLLENAFAKLKKTKRNGGKLHAES